MPDNTDARAEEIVVIRRRHGEGDHGHHGGAWKIAYADFMTAMMALFLVMWLINASNTETRASVAAYFNPIKLTDNVSRIKGLQDPVAGAPKKGKISDAGTPAASDKKLAEGKKTNGKSVRDLEEPKGSAAAGLLNVQAESQNEAENRSRNGYAQEAGRGFRDPFNPSLPHQALSNEGNSSVVSVSKQAWPEVVRAPPPPARLESASRNATRPDQVKEEGSEKENLEGSARKMLRAVKAAAAQLGAQAGPEVDVKVEDGALVLSLTDTSTFGMFAIGSAEPNMALTKLMQSIAPLISANSTGVIVRGHTDARPYRNERNNNWRLSMSRAEAAMTMLVRAGIEQGRFERVEAYADRKLKISEDAEAASNRRIEIVLRRDKT